MPLLDKIREEKLIDLAKACFDPPPSEAEEKVLRDSASSEDLPEPGERAPRSEVRAAFLRWLATDPEAAPHIDPKGLRVYAATIPGRLDLRECHVNPTLEFRRCGFQGEIDLRFAETRGLFFFDSSLAGSMDADRVNVHGPLFLRRTHSEGEIHLLGAKIKGNLDCSGTKLGAKGNALDAEGAQIGGSIYLQDGFESEGEIRLLGTQIEGKLSCTGAKLRAKGNALNADNAQIGGSIFLQHGFESEGEIRLLSAEIKGQLACTGAKLRAKSNALNADGAQIGGGVFLVDGFESEGEIRLPGAKIKGPLACTGAKLRAKGNALNAEGAQIGGGIYLQDGFESEGEIRLLGARIEGDLSCTGAKLKAKGNALNADGAKIVGAVFLNKDFESEGEIHLLGVEITGQLVCSGAKLKAKCKALSVDCAKIGGSVFLDDSIESEGMIRLPGTEIGGDVSIRGAKVTKVVCQNTVIKGDLIWQSIEKSEKTKLSLAGAKVKNLRDDRESWPAPGRLILDGLAFEELTLHQRPSEVQVMNSSHSLELPFNVDERVEWLMLQPPDRRINPQPWMQLRDLLERKGDRKGAKHVIYKLRRLQAENEWFLRRRLAIAFAWLEEAPGRICCSIACFLLLGWLVFGYAGSHGALAPTEAEAYKAFIAGSPPPSAYPRLNPFLYTLDNAVPLVKLGQDEKWAPDRRYPGTNWFTNYWFLVWSRVVLIYLGWFQAGVLGAALLRRFKE